jgi:shikimate kinase
VKVKVQALGTTADRWTRQVMMNCLYFSLDHMLNYILTIKQSQGSDIPKSSGESGSSSSSSAYVVTVACNVQNSKSYYLKPVKVTQMSHLLSLSLSFMQ